MASLINDFLHSFTTSDNLRDFQHASRIFTDNNYRLSPKYGFLFHVAFDINDELSSVDRDNRLEMGMLVKTVDLPKFTIENKVFNAYGRTNVVQNKLKYDQLNLTFHDDSADLIRDFWYSYFNYYYRDSDYGESIYQQPSKYKSRMMQDWGYTPAYYSSSTMASAQYLRSIRIYSLHQKRFSEYVLINPTIVAFRHGQHANGENTNLMEHTMTIAYETVKYYTGYVTENTVVGFADLHYDKTPSPLTPAGGGTNSVFGPGGALGTVDEVINDLSNGNFLSAILKGGRAIASGRFNNLGAKSLAEIGSMARNVLRGGNPLQSINVPSIFGNGMKGGSGLAGLLGGVAGGAGIAGLLGGASGFFRGAKGAQGIPGIGGLLSGGGFGGGANGVNANLTRAIPGLGALAGGLALTGAVTTGGRNVTGGGSLLSLANSNLLKNPFTTAGQTRSIFPKDAATGLAINTPREVTPNEESAINGLDMYPDGSDINMNDGWDMASEQDDLFLQDSEGDSNEDWTGWA
jgi:hypothetical protein